MAEPHDVVQGDQMWDGQGRCWQRGRPRWLDARAVSRWIHRGGVVACQDPASGELTWWGPQQAAEWWARCAPALEVPGVVAAEAADADGRTCGALLWRCGDDRLLGVQVFC